MQITIDNLNGVQNYDIYVCDSGYTSCIYFDTITNAQQPYTFLVPPPYDNLTPVCLRIIDNIGCEFEICSD